MRLTIVIGEVICASTYLCMYCVLISLLVKFMLSVFFMSYQLTPEEEEKRRVRRERNKLAAAKCRNRRRELTDRLQSVSDSNTNLMNFIA